jgi:TPP-dependent pyruvate/acetoin dehydrogenase alpha subunit
MPTKTAKKNSSPIPVPAPQKPLEPGENPLVPHETLRQMYLKMLHARLLTEHLAGKAKTRLAASVHGQEACRASVAQVLVQGDLVADSQPGPLMSLVLGARPSDLLQKKPVIPPPPSSLLPFLDAADDRLNATLGAAFALKHLGRAGVAAVFVEQDEAGSKLWRRCLTVAVRQELPILFIALADAKHDGRARLTAVAHASGASGIAVDATDAIALYRVVQESMIRLRTSGGPVLIEAIAFLPDAKSKALSPDPVAAMRQCLIQRKAATEAWMKSAESAFRQQLSKAKT